MSQLIRTGLAALAKIEKIIAGTCIAALTILMVMDVGRREILNEGIDWAQKFSLHMMFWAGMLGASIISSKGGHLRPEIADKLWPKKMLPLLKGIEHLLIAGFCAGLGFISLQFVRESLSLGTRNPVTDLPLWLVQAVIPYALGSMAFRHLMYAFSAELRPTDKNEAQEALEADIEKGA